MSIKSCLAASSLLVLWAGAYAPNELLWGRIATPLGAREELIAQIAAPMFDWQLIASDDGSRIAWREKRNGKWVVLLNGHVQGGVYDEVDRLRFSPDFSRLAFAAKKGKDWTVVVEGNAMGGSYRELSFRFSPDSSHVMTYGKDKDGERFIFDGKSQQAYKEVMHGVFSTDGAHAAYAAKKGKQWTVVLDGVEGPLYDEVMTPEFRKGESVPVYAARRDKTWMVIDNGRETRPTEIKDGYYAIAGFTDKLQMLTLKIFDGSNSKLMIGNTAGPLGDMLNVPFNVSSDGLHTVYATAHIKRPGGAAERAVGQVVMDGRAGPEYQGQPVEGAATAWFRALGGGGTLRLRAGDFDEFTAVRQGVSTPDVSPDGMHVAYAARRGKNDFVVNLDGREGPRMEGIACAPRFSPAGDLYYAGIDSGKLMVIANEKKLSEYPFPAGDWQDICTNIVFKEDHSFFGVMLKDELLLFVDGQVAYKKPKAAVMAAVTARAIDGRFHFAYCVSPSAERPKFQVVVDGNDGKTYDDVWPDTLHWSGDDAITYVARDGSRLMRVTQTTSPD
jgi:hypothetical protein